MKKILFYHLKGRLEMKKLLITCTILSVCVVGYFMYANNYDTSSDLETIPLSNSLVSLDAESNNQNNSDITFVDSAFNAVYSSILVGCGMNSTIIRTQDNKWNAYGSQKKGRKFHKLIHQLELLNQSQLELDTQFA